MGPIGCPETSVMTYKSTVGKIPVERRPVHRGGGLKSRTSVFLRNVGMFNIYVNSFISLSYDRSKASSKASSPHSAI